MLFENFHGVRLGLFLESEKPTCVTTCQPSRLYTTEICPVKFSFSSIKKPAARRALLIIIELENHLHSAVTCQFFYGGFAYILGQDMIKQCQGVSGGKVEGLSYAQAIEFGGAFYADSCAV